MTHIKKLLLMVLLYSSAAVSAASMEEFQSEEKTKQPNLHNSNVTNPIAPSGLGESTGGGSGALKWITAFSGSTTNSFSVPAGDFYEINGRVGSSMTVTASNTFTVNTCAMSGNHCKIMGTKAVKSTGQCTVSISNGVLKGCAVTLSARDGYCAAAWKCTGRTITKKVHGVVTKVRYLGL